MNAQSKRWARFGVAGVQHLNSACQVQKLSYTRIRMCWLLDARWAVEYVTMHESPMSQGSVCVLHARCQHWLRMCSFPRLQQTIY